ncbi:MAG: hypothetical protein ACREIA_01000 [Opitutaceae bacterium]
MSIKQLEKEIRQTSRAGELRLPALLRHELRTGTSAYQPLWEQAHADIESGAYVTLEQLRRLSRAHDRIEPVDER